MKHIADGIVSFTADEVADMLRETMKAEGIDHEMIAVQIVTADGEVRNEIPRVNVILANAGM